MPQRVNPAFDLTGKQQGVGRLAFFEHQPPHPPCAWFADVESNVNVELMLPNEIEILEEAFDIALSVLLRFGDLEEFDEATHFLATEIAELMSNGEKSRLLLSNFAIDAYRLKHRCTYLQLQPKQIKSM
jgi:hypothetical protein